MLRNVEVVPYNPEWPRLFLAEAEALRGIFKEEIVAVHHIGSTSIPNLSAKPIIDLLVEVRRIDRIDAYDDVMRAAGYFPRGEFGISGRRFFAKGSEIHRTHHIHMFQTGDPQVERHLNFRDYMIAHPDEAQAYGRLKEELARRFPTDIVSYMDGKDAFIKEIDRKAHIWKEQQNAK